MNRNIANHISSGGFSDIDANRRDICQACGDTNCHDCCLSFLHRGKKGHMVRIYIKNKQVSKIEFIERIGV